MKDQHLKVEGYRDFDQKTLVNLNRVKEAEKQVGALWQEFAQNPDIDPRQLALAKTEFEGAFSRMVRSVAQAEDPYGSQPRRS